MNSDKPKPKKIHRSVTAVMLVATLKAKPTESNTEVLCEVLADELAVYGITADIIRLADYRLEPGIETQVKSNDHWPKLLKRVLAADIIIFATPIWWGNMSSILQRVIERMDALNDELLETGVSPFANKVGGMVITGAEDGAQHVIGNLCNFMIWNGLTIPPAASLSYLGTPGETKEVVKRTFMRKPVKGMAQITAQNLAHAVEMITVLPYPEKKANRSQNIRPDTVGTKA